MSTRILTTLRRPIVPLTVIALAIGAIVWGVTADGSGSAQGGGTSAIESEPESDESRVHLLEPFERVATDSLTDWVNAADFVVSVTVLSEKRVEPGRTETSPHGEGLVGRLLTLRVDDTLWSSGGERAVPETLEVRSASGWIRHEETETKTSLSGASRIEVGNQYAVGLVWKPAQCFGELRSPASWATLGSGAVVPANEGVVGVGEFQGTTTTARDAGEERHGPQVAIDFAGASVAELASELRKTQPTERVPFIDESELCR